MEKQYQYSSIGQRFRSEWKIYLLAFIFIFIADSIGQINIPPVSYTHLDVYKRQSKIR